MDVLVRCDSSVIIGTGHVARCLTLAERLKDLGKSVTFVCRPLKGNCIDLVRARGFEIILLEAPSDPICDLGYKAWLEVPEEREFAEFDQILDKFKPKWVVCDHYALDQDWENMCFSHGIKVFAIDDVFRLHQADYLLDQNCLGLSGINSYRESRIRSKAFFGPQHALLPGEFRENLGKNILFQEVKKILVFCGGVDQIGLTERLVDLILGSLNVNSPDFDIVVGKSNPMLSEIEKKVATSSKFNLHVQTSKMAKLMAESDLFIGAGGVTTWERTYLGLPAIVIAIAENQVAFSRAMGEIGAQIYLGKADVVADNEIMESIKFVAENLNVRKKLQKNSLELNVGSKTQEMIEVFC